MRFVFRANFHLRTLGYRVLNVDRTGTTRRLLLRGLFIGQSQLIVPQSPMRLRAQQELASWGQACDVVICLTTAGVGSRIRAAMARHSRVDVAGGLYHLITRGNNRRTICEAPADYHKFLSLLAAQKIQLSFYLYAYCLMTNHVHLLIERQSHSVSRS